MAKRTTLRLVPTSTLVGGTPPVMWGDARHPAGALRLRPPVPDTEHIRDLEGALVRIAGLCRDRPAVMEIISGVLFEEPTEGGDGPRWNS